MKATLCCAAALCLLTTGCQSTPVAMVDPGYDTVMMARVEGAARASGVTVVWINPPLLKKAEIARN